MIQILDMCGAEKQEPIQHIEATIKLDQVLGNTRIIVIQGDIIREKSDALLNASDDPFDTPIARQLKLNRVALSPSIPEVQSLTNHKIQFVIHLRLPIEYDESSNQRIHAYVKALQMGQYHSLSFQDPGYSILHSRPKNYNAVQFLQALEFILSETELKEVKLINLDSTFVAMYCEEVTILAARHSKRKSQSQLQIKVEIADHEELDDGYQQEQHDQNKIPQTEKQQVTFEQLLQQVHITGSGVNNNQTNNAQNNQPEVVMKVAENVIQIHNAEPEIASTAQEQLTMTFGQNQGKSNDIIENVLENIKVKQQIDEQQNENNQNLDTPNQIGQDSDSNNLKSADVQDINTINHLQQIEAIQEVQNINDQIPIDVVEITSQQQRISPTEIDEQKHSDIVFSTDNYTEIAKVNYEVDEADKPQQQLIKVDQDRSSIHDNPIESVIIKEMIIHHEQIDIQQNAQHPEIQTEISELINNQSDITQDANKVIKIEVIDANIHQQEHDQQLPQTEDKVDVPHQSNLEQKDHKEEVKEQPQIQTETITYQQSNSEQKDESTQRHTTDIHLEINRETKIGNVNINIEIHQNPKSPQKQESPLRIIKEESSEQKQQPDNLQETILVISKQILSELTEKAISQLMN